MAGADPGGGPRGSRAPPWPLGFEAPKLSICGPYLIFPFFCLASLAGNGWTEIRALSIVVKRDETVQGLVWVTQPRKESRIPLRPVRCRRHVMFHCRLLTRPRARSPLGSTCPLNSNCDSSLKNINSPKTLFFFGWGGWGGVAQILSPSQHWPFRRGVEGEPSIWRPSPQWLFMFGQRIQN